MIRSDYADVVYRTKKEKYNAVVEEIVELHEKGQPVLVGTISIENSETLSQDAQEPRRRPTTSSTPSTTSGKRRSSPRPGRKGALTISTNMAGRGTDIMLGGNPVFLAKRGAAIPQPIPRRYAEALERYQKAQCAAEREEVTGGGRAPHPGHRAPREPPHRQPAARPFRPPGRPGFDPLLSLSLEDDLMRIFGSDGSAGS